MEITTRLIDATQRFITNVLTLVLLLLFHNKQVYWALFLLTIL
jgi:hypothetical protein